MDNREMDRPVSQVGSIKLGVPLKVMIAINDAWNIYNFRAGLIRSFLDKGYEVIAVAPAGEYAARLEAMGCRFLEIPIDSQGTSPVRDILLLSRFIRLLRRERPDIFLGYTVKPNVYGSMAAHVLGIPVINNITGLGASFINHGILTRIVSQLYKASLRKSRRVFFQNGDDRHHFIESGLVHQDVTELLPGSGVNIEHFSAASSTGRNSHHGERPFRFLLIGRLLWDKGVGEFVDAARELRKKYPHVEFCLLGFLNVENPAAISREQVDAWIEEGVVDYLGVTDDVRQEIENADCIVLPSYREGAPRSLLEAAAMAKPIIATDTVGCREVVVHDETGKLCAVRDAEDLAEKMEQMLEMPHEERIEMGRRGRKRVIEQFDEQIVIRKYHDAIDEILYPVP